MKFLDALVQAKKGGKNVVIPDIKRFSPKDGELLCGRSPSEYARILVNAGAPVLSVVTEEKEFHGSLQMLKEIAGTVNVPILRKDFIHTKADLEETVQCGASAILLMCSCLEPDEMRFLYKEALELGLDPFVETHKPEDFALVKELGAKLVGINNRDILKLERDEGNVSHTVEMIGGAPKYAFLVTESSIKDPEEVRTAVNGGADAALVGTAIAIAPDPAVFYNMLTRKTSCKICGLMNEHDIDICVRNGVEKIGLVTEYPLYVPWNLSADRAAELAACVPKGFRSVMVTGGTNEKILALVEKVKPDMVQLHYEETLEQSAFLAHELGKKGISVIKTVPMERKSCALQFGTEDIDEAVRMLNETEVAELLVDPRHGKDVAVKNLSADEELFDHIRKISKKPVVLAGGLNSDNLKDTLQRTNAEYIDIMNGSENEPGSKSEEKIRGIIASL